MDREGGRVGAYDVEPEAGCGSEAACEAGRKRCGRPPGIDPERAELLAAFAEQGLTLSEMAAVLGVSRQCIHAQLKKCGALQHVRKAKVSARRRRNRARRAYDRGVRWLKERGEWQLLRFLQEAELHDWSVDLEPGTRVRVNGVPLAFHRPRRLHGNRRNRGTRYYHVQITRPEWLHVVFLPDGRYEFYLPNEVRKAGTQYIRAQGDAPPWPDWPSETMADRSRAAWTESAERRPRTQRRAA